MSGEKQCFASCSSTHPIDFPFPYKGGSSFNLYLRNLGKGNEVLLYVSKGQFLHSILGSQNCRVKFDDEPPLKFSYNSPADGSSNTIFLEKSDHFLKKLKTCKKVKIEAPFFQAGNKIIEFEAEGLVWDR